MKTSKILYYCLLGAVGFLALSVVFYTVGGIVDLGEAAPLALRSSQPEDGAATLEADDGTTSWDEVINNKNVTLKTIPVIGEVYHDRKQIADSFNKLQVGLRIIPSQNDEAGFVVMGSTNEDNAEDSRLGDKVDKEDNYFLFT
jgi:hypothetical protein